MIRDFFRAMFAHWLTAMGSGVAVAFWAASAILACFNVWIPLQIGFAVCGVIATFVASYGVWRKATLDGVAAMDATTARSDKAAAELEAHWSAKYEALERHTKELEATATDLAAKAERRRADYRLTEGLNRLISAGNAIRAKLLAGGNATVDVAAWEQEAGVFIDAQIPAYSAHYRSDAGIASAGYPGDPTARAMTHLDRRLTRLSEILHRIVEKG